MNRGSVGREVRQAPERGASMRPRFMNRGSHAAVSDDTLAGFGFNEAPIHESGKWPDRFGAIRRDIELQ